MKFNPVIPEFFVLNMDASLQFYLGILGFKAEYSRENGRFQFLSYENAQLMLFQENDTASGDPESWITGALQFPRGRGMNLQIEVSDLEPLLGSIRQRGHSLYSPPTERRRDVQGTTISEVEFLVQDPDGYLLRFSSTN